MDFFRETLHGAAWGRGAGGQGEERKYLGRQAKDSTVVPTSQNCPGMRVPLGQGPVMFTPLHLEVSRQKGLPVNIH